MRIKLVKLEDVTLERILAARAVRATDGCISRLLWENPIAGTSAELFVAVDEVTDECVAPVKHRLCCLLLQSQQDHESSASGRAAAHFAHRT